MSRPSIIRPCRARWAAGLVVAALPVLVAAAPASSSGDPPPETPAAETAPVDAPPPVDLPPPGDGQLSAEAGPDIPLPDAVPGESGRESGGQADVASSGAASATKTTEGAEPGAGVGKDVAAAEPKKKKKKKQKKTTKKEKHKVNQGTQYHLGLFPASYVQDPRFSLGAKAGIRQRIDPKKSHPITLGLYYEYEPYSTKTLGFPEEDDVNGGLLRTLVEPIHSLEGVISRRIEWNKWVTTSLDVSADAWWPARDHHQRWSTRMTPGIRIGRTTGIFGEINSELYYKKFPNYYIDSVMRRIDQEGLTPTGIVGYNHRKLVRASAGFAFDFTHYLDAHYNAIAADGTVVRSNKSKNYLDFIPFADLVLRPTKGLRIRARYAFERQRTQHYDRVMAGRDEFASLTDKFFHGYYDYRRHRANLWISWEFRDRLRLAAAAAAWVRHFDVYEARTVDNFWTGELRLDTEIEGSLEVAVRLHTIERPKMKHDFFLSLLGSHVSRRSNMKHEISLATNFDITRVFLGFEVRGH